MKSKTVPGFDMIAGRALMVMHTFRVAADGQLEHLTDGILRATVPPEGWEGYCAQYPEAQDIIDELTRPVQIAEPAQAAPVPSVQEQLAAALAKVQELQAQQQAADELAS